MSEMNTARRNLAFTNQLAKTLWLELRRDTDVNALRQQVAIQQQSVGESHTSEEQAEKHLSPITTFFASATSTERASETWTDTIANAFKWLLDSSRTEERR